MRTLLICGAEPVPPELRELIERGSTSVDVQQAADADTRLPEGVDRVVFWSAPSDGAVQTLARRYAKKEAAERREVIVFVTSGRGDSGAAPELSPNEVYEWPRDQDRLTMAFLTGG
jgi:hypothetical protein